ncbi:MAG: hypothetical protein WCF67_13175, partial [Chitinophagaceae bacterium]
MIIHQAYFGDDNGSHNLLATSIDSSQLIGKLKLTTDAPNSIQVSYPFLSGTFMEGHYIFTRTFPDMLAKRPGMVFSHCLILPLESLSNLNNLKGLLRLFVSSSIKEKVILGVAEIEETNSFVPKPPMFDTILDCLLKNKQTIVYPGYEGFEDVVCYLWPRLSTILRETFSFTISGRPSEVLDQSYTIVHTPHELEQRWTNFSIIRQRQDVEKSKAFMLIENPELEDSFKLQQFIQEHAILYKHLHQIPGIEKLYQLVSAASQQSELVFLKRCFIGVNKWVPHSQTGKETKIRLLTFFLKKILETDDSGFKLLRNMSFSAFEKGLEQVITVSQQWSSKYINPNEDGQVSAQVGLLKESFFGDAQNWWNEIVLDRFQTLFQSIDEESAKWIWKVWIEDSTLIDQTTKWLALETERFLVKASPKDINAPVLQALMTVCVDKKWLSLHAIIVAQLFEPEQAISAQLKFDGSANLEEHISLMLPHISDEAFVVAATKIDDMRIYQIAGKRCALKQSLLQLLNVRITSWQLIWYYAYQVSGQISQGISDLQSELYKLFDLKIAKQYVHSELLQVLLTQVEDVSSYDKRKALSASLD